MKKIILICSFILLWTFCSLGQLVILDGVYAGKKIYIKNSGTSGKGDCVEKVMINNKEMTFKNIEVFEINPDSLGFNIGDTLKIILFHKLDCKPYALLDNATYFTFRITSLNLDESGLLKWTAEEKNNTNPFIVQQFVDNKWTKIGEVASKGDMKENEYFFKIPSEIKAKEFRLMQVDKLGKTNFSKSIKISSSK